MLKKAERERLRPMAINLRHRGYSYPMIERKLGVRRATLSGWFSGLVLGKQASKRILTRKRRALHLARMKAAKSKKEASAHARLQMRQVAEQECEKLPWTATMKEIVLATLYLGEGFKRHSVVGLGNADARILKMFVELLRDVYTVEEHRLRCFLHLRSDQSVETEERYWSKILAIPRGQFRKAQFDQRTAGKKTWPEYHGVCVVYCYDARIEKRLTAFQDILKSMFETSLDP